LKKVFAVCSCVALGVLIAGCGNRGGGVVATVNGEAITMDEFVGYLKTKERVRVVTNQGMAEARVAETLAYQAMEDMIMRRIVAQLARDEKVFPTDAETINEIEFRKKLSPNFVQLMNAQGMNWERIKEQLRIELATERLLSKGITITDDQLDKFIADNKLDREPATADLIWVFVKTPALRAQVDSDLKSGTSFSTVAARYTEAPRSKEQNCRYPTRVLAQLPDVIRPTVQKTSEGQSTDWVPGDGGWAKFFVEKKAPERKLTLDAAKREFYRREMAKAQGARAKDLDKRITDKLFESDVSVGPKELADLWKIAMERARKDRKVDIPAATGAPAADDSSP